MTESSANPANLTDLVDASTLAITRSNDFWFDDGSIVLVVEETYFRVHRSILSRSSTFFKDMFQIRQPLNERKIEGCFTVHLPDPRDDWENLLTALYYPMKLRPDDFPLGTLASMLRLGKKYQFDEVWKNGLSRLHMEIPRDLDAWDRKLNPLNKDYPTLASIDSWIVHKEIAIVNLAVELGLESILPVAYYLCAVLHSPDDILINNQKDAQDIEDSVFRLSSTAQRTVVLGGLKIRNVIASQIIDIMKQETPSSGCTTPERCRVGRAGLIRTATQALTREELGYALNILSPTGQGYMNFLCSSCVLIARRQHESSRVDIWNQLPSYFGLACWGDLAEYVE